MLEGRNGLDIYSVSATEDCGVNSEVYFRHEEDCDQASEQAVPGTKASGLNQTLEVLRKSDLPTRGRTGGQTNRDMMHLLLKSASDRDRWIMVMV